METSRWEKTGPVGLGEIEKASNYMGGEVGRSRRSRKRRNDNQDELCVKNIREKQSKYREQLANLH